jgi:hypothetical protein
MVSSFNVKCKSDGAMWGNDLIYFNKLWAKGHVKVTKDTEYANRLLCNEHLLTLKHYNRYCSLPQSFTVY